MVYERTSAVKARDRQLRFVSHNQRFLAVLMPPHCLGDRRVVMSTPEQTMENAQSVASLVSSQKDVVQPVPRLIRYMT